jgi:hypothetical protein
MYKQMPKKEYFQGDKAFLDSSEDEYSAQIK